MSVGAEDERTCPVYLSSSLALSENIIMSVHRKTLHGRVASAMSEVRSL